MSRITAWSINVVWSDGTEQIITDIPYYASKHVDDFLTELEDHEPVEDERNDPH